jgi:hypothetical protein
MKAFTWITKQTASRNRVEGRQTLKADEISAYHFEEIITLKFIHMEPYIKKDHGRLTGTLPEGCLSTVPAIKYIRSFYALSKEDC